MSALNGGRLAKQIAVLLIQHGVRMAEWAGWKGSGDRNGPACRNLVYFVLCQLTGAYPAYYPIVVLD